MFAIRVAVLAILVPAATISAQERAGLASLTQSLEGVWRQVEVRSNDETVIGNQPGFRLFLDGYYSLVRVEGLVPRVALSATPTAEELAAAWTPFTAQIGTYEVVDGQTITTRPVVAKNPAVMAGGNFTTSTVRIRGDTLWVTNIRNQAGPIANAGGYGKYVRVRQ